MKHLCVSRLIIWRQNWVTGVLHDSLVARQVSSGRIIVVLFWTKYVFPRQVKPGILKLTNRRGQSKFTIFFIFVSCEQKGYCFGRTAQFWPYCGRSCRMQGNGETGATRAPRTARGWAVGAHYQSQWWCQATDRPQSSHLRATRTQHAVRWGWATPISRQTELSTLSNGGGTHEVFASSVRYS